MMPSCDPVGVVALQSAWALVCIVFITKPSSESSSMREAPMGRCRLERNAVARSVPEGYALALYEVSKDEKTLGKRRRNRGQRAGIDAAMMARLLSMGEAAKPRE